MKKKNKILINSVLSVAALSSFCLSGINNVTTIQAKENITQITGATHSSSFDVDSLTLQPGETTSSINVNWYADSGAHDVQIQFGNQLKSVDVRELTTPTKVDSSKYTDTGKKVCSTTFEGLEADTQYTYYITNDGGNTWSEAYTYTTPSNDSFKFGFTSDPQIKESKETNTGGWNPSDGTNQTGWKTMMNVLGEQDIDLLVSAGDQVEDQSWGKSSEYEAFFAPNEMTSIPYAPAVGNHDRHYMFDDHFNLPNEMTSLTEVKTTFRGQNSGTSQSHGNYIQATQQEITNDNESNGVKPNSEGQYDFAERRIMETNGNYYYLYNNVLFVTLNTSAYPGGNDALEGENTSNTSSLKDNSEAEAIINNFNQTLSSAVNEYQNKYQWIVVSHHKSTQTVAKHAADSDIENYVDAGFEKLMDQYDVDFVLGGHDHVYSRSYVLKDGQRNSERLDNFNDVDGTIYLTGNCCSDMQYYTPFEKVDKGNNVDYPILANGETGSQGYLNGALPIGNQEYNQEFSPSYALFDVTGDTIKVKVYNLDGDSETPSSKEIDAFTVTKNVSTGLKPQAFNNDQSLLDLEKIATYNSGSSNADGGVMEIVDYNTTTNWAYAINGQSGKLTAIDVKDLESKDTVDLLDGNDIDIKSLVESSSFKYGDMTSIAVSNDGKQLAVSIQEEDYTKNGEVALFDCHQDGTISLHQIYTVGVQPDMILFTNDDQMILTANEGEPREGYTQTDPQGSISIINTQSSTSTTKDFTSFDALRETLVNKGVVLKKNTLPSVDLEPEYIAVSDTHAYVTLQENNAIAVLNLETLEIENVESLGLEDYSINEIDIDKKDEAYHPQTYQSLRGIRMSDGISVTTIDGIDYIMTANEGDSREWGDYLNEDERNFAKGKTSPTGNITAENSGLSGKVVFFDTSDYDGLDTEYDYLFGGRSATLFKYAQDTLQEVYSTTNEFEQLTASYLPDNFNCSNDDQTIDDRSGKKGVEAESVTIGKIKDQLFAFIGLERVGGVMVYNITNPQDVQYVNYINTRDFSEAIAGDDSPEGLHFISEEDSVTDKPQLLVAYEVSGTVGVYNLDLETETNTQPGDPTNDQKPEIGIQDVTNQPNDKQPQNQAVDTSDATSLIPAVLGLLLSMLLSYKLIQKKY